MARILSGEGIPCSYGLKWAMEERNKSASKPATNAPVPTPPAKTPTDPAATASSYRLSEGNCDHLIRKR